MLRPTTLNQVLRAIDQSGYFKSEDFSVTTTDTDYESKLRLHFLYDERYFLEATIPIKKSALDNTGFVAALQSKRFAFCISGTTSPGEMSTQEPFECENIDGLQKVVLQWIERLKSEFRMAPIFRELDLQKEKLDQMMAKVECVPDEYFSRQEADALRQRLDDLESRLTEGLNQRKQDKDEVQNQVNAIHSDIEMLKDALNNLKKPGGAKIFTIRLFKWASVPENREMLSSGAHLAKDLILEAGKHLPQIPPSH
jgi:Zn-finger nucleic acid-binding protein